MPRYTFRRSAMLFTSHHLFGVKYSCQNTVHLEGFVALRATLQPVSNPLLLVQDSRLLVLCNLGQLLPGLTQLPLQTSIDALQVTKALYRAALGYLHHYICICSVTELAAKTGKAKCIVIARGLEGGRGGGVGGSNGGSLGTQKQPRITELAKVMVSPATSG